MTVRSQTGRPGARVGAHSAVFEVHERMLGASRASGRHVEVSSGRVVHVIEAGDGVPVVFLHGSSTSSLSLLPVLERLEGVRSIAVDRPGFGLSEPAPVPRARFREAAVEFIDEIVEELELDSLALAGNSMGGTWALWYALAHPERLRQLVLLGSAPLLPGTRPPAPLRVMATPVVGDLLTRVMKPTPRTLVQLMSSLGEKETIVRHPGLIEALVAEGRDPLASAVNLAELRAAISPVGFRQSVRVQPNELRRLSVPTLLIWGDHDPVGAVDSAQTTAMLIPEARLELLPGGHVPYLGNPEPVAELVRGFVR